MGRIRVSRESSNTSAKSTCNNNVPRGHIGGIKKHKRKRENRNAVIQTDGEIITTGAGDATDPTSVDDLNDFFANSDLGSYDPGKQKNI